MLISITINVSEELEALFESMVMDVENDHYVYQFIEQLVTSTHVFLRGGERVELYLKDRRGRLQLLDTTRTLSENCINSKV